MTDEKALLAAIWEHPHEDAPRLVYADWLQENGQPERAEFTRVQCQLATLDEWDEEERPTLEKREAKLRKKCEKAWRAALPADVRKAPFRRGFVAPEPRQVTATRFCELPASAFAAAPAWRYTVEGTAGLEELAESANLLRVESIKFWSSVTPDAAPKVLGSPLLRNVRTISLGFGNEWVKWLSLLAANPHAASLAELDIYEGFSDEHAAVLASSPGFAKLRTLSAPHHTVTPKGLEAVFNSPILSNLTDLTLPGWYREEGALAIAATRPKFRLRMLNMYGAWMTDAGVAAIAKWPGLESVRDLTIGGQCQTLGPRALAKSPYAHNLRRLDLGLSRLDRDGALALAKSKTLDLRLLEIRMTPAANDDEAVTALQQRFGKDAVKVRYPGQRKQS